MNWMDDFRFPPPRVERVSGLPDDWFAAERRARLSRAQRGTRLRLWSAAARRRLSVIPSGARDLLFGFAALGLLLLLSWLIVSTGGAR